MIDVLDWYRGFMDRMRNAYFDLVNRIFEDKPTKLAWRRFERETEETMKAVDFTASAAMRRAANDSRVRVPDPEDSIHQTIHKNRLWYSGHAEISHPYIADVVDRVTQVEKEYYARRADVVKGTDIPNNRLTLMYRNTLGQVKATAEQIELSDPDISQAFPYVEYFTRDDSRVRPTHALMHGLIAFRTWEGLSVIRPKNGYNCRCFLIYRSWPHALRKGWAEERGVPKWTVKWPSTKARLAFENGEFPDPGWGEPKFVAPY